MRCKIDNWRFENGTVCPFCGFDNPVEKEPLVVEPKKSKIVPKVEPKKRSHKKKPQGG